MKIDIIQEEAFDFEKDFNKKKIGDSDEVDLGIKDNYLCIFVKNKSVASLQCKDCLVDIYKNRIVVFD